MTVIEFSFCHDRLLKYFAFHRPFNQQGIKGNHSNFQTFAVSATVYKAIDDEALQGAFSALHSTVYLDCKVKQTCHVECLAPQVLYTET